MLNIGFQIICRYNSHRLPGKILREIKGKPILQYIVERVNEVVPKEQIVISTSVEPTDDPIIEYCQQNGLNYFRGSLDNVSERFLNCALANNFDYTTRINGDNIFVDISLLEKMTNIAKSGQYELISNLKNRTFPKGMSIEIVRTKYYEGRYKNFTTPDDFEHVTLNLYQNEEADKYFYVLNDICPDAGGIQLAIDTKEDFSLASKIISNFAGSHLDYGLSEVYHFYTQFKK